MEITISVSEKTARIIQHQAEETGKNISDFARDLFEEKIAEEFSDSISSGTDTNGVIEKKSGRKHNLLTLAGMFSGGDGKTSENYKQILRNEIDSVAGFTTDKEK